MKDKIAIFYVIAQMGNWWEDEFYTKQINRLTSSGLYDQIEFIDIMVGGGYKPLPSLPSKVRDVMYLQPKGLNAIEVKVDKPKANPIKTEVIEEEKSKDDESTEEPEV